MTDCAAPDPADPAVLCDKPAPCYGYHANAPAGRIWPGTPLPDPEPAKGPRTRKGALAMIAQRAKR